MSSIKKINNGSKIRTITHNNFITAEGLAQLPLKSRKLLYIAISQCRKIDDSFYEYKLSIPDFAQLMGIDESNVYEEASNITDKLMCCIVKCYNKEMTGYKTYHLFDICNYNYDNDGMITFKIHPEMTNLFLHLRRDFSQPLLSDFLKMKSPYSMAIWHLMQREMHSKKPGTSDKIEFDLSVEEIRRVTGTEKKFVRLSDLKRYILDKALREIKNNCGVEISYQNIKSGKTVVSFHFTAINALVHYELNEISQEALDKVERLNLKKLAKTRELTSEEKRRYDSLTNQSYQMEFKYVPPKKR